MLQNYIIELRNVVEYLLKKYPSVWGAEGWGGKLGTDLTGEPVFFWEELISGNLWKRSAPLFRRQESTRQGERVVPAINEKMVKTENGTAVFLIANCFYCCCSDGANRLEYQYLRY